MVRSYTVIPSKIRKRIQDVTDRVRERDLLGKSYINAKRREGDRIYNHKRS